MSNQYIIEHGGRYECGVSSSANHGIALYIYQNTNNITRSFPCGDHDTDVFFFAIHDVKIYVADSFFTPLRAVV
jgi:hypothetical protein